MAGFFSFVAVLAFIALLVGLVKPSLVVRWGKPSPTRKQVLKTYGISYLVLAVLAVASAAPESDSSGDTASSASAPDGEASSLLEHSVLDRQLSETPGKTQVSTDILVPEDASDEDLTSLLRHLHEEESRRSGFKYHDHPTVIGIYAYPSREHAASGMGQWLAMLTKTPTDDEPSIRLRPRGDASNGQEERFGLSEQQRKDAFQRTVRAEDRGQREAEREFPSDLRRQYERADQLADEYKAALAQEIEITREQLYEIGVEASQKNWPLPRP